MAEPTGPTTSREALLRDEAERFLDDRETSTREAATRAIGTKRFQRPI
jgi:hypothetical protein